MTETLRWGILGAAAIARSALAPAIARAEGAHLAALATTSGEKAAPFLARYPGLRVIGDYQALLDDPDVDAVYIPLPNHLHVEWTLRALDAGKHVLCEKPLALDAEQIKSLIAARDRSGKLAAEGFMVVHHPQWQAARALIADGAIGKLQHIDGAFTYRNLDPANIRNQAATGGGGLYDIGVYPSITARFVTGAEPTRLRADIQRENGVDTFARVWADFPEFTMSFYVGMRQAARQEMVFHGEDGWLRLNAPFNTNLYGDVRLDIRLGDGTTRSQSYNSVDQYQLMIEAFCRSVRTGEPFACPLEFSYGNQKMIDAILAADPA
ncbi:Gfo/Idh/MocA family protein [Pelagibacterium xiamenense]|uniref:Gfo/Idh/MocA family protein n=1 Tax=Pelagibacterium xiamenense TaxID=2901140 RepID=UPI001E4A6CBC|nr:Gfo/Idh/MocA family oxidoreductase [Pelagibacterium xiamenense]MCD7059842.1 Gfo/Idh/MocA family oxidoreductase [Pelagibacterium xiamenense]